MTAAVRLGTLVLFASALVFGIACEGSKPAPSAAVKPGAASGPAAAPAATAETSTTSAEAPYEYVYSPVGKRDPFRSLLLDLQEHPAGQSGSGACQSPLCRYDLDQFKLVGIVSGMSNPIAMVEDPKGKGWILQRGTQIGRNAGKVSQIRPTSVVVTEIVRTTGKPVPNPIEMKMPADKTVEPEEEEDMMQQGAVQ
jgi:type IV pilus assembly protein PilP